MGDSFDPEHLQRNVFPWVGPDDPFSEKHHGTPAHKQITLDEVVTKGMPRLELQKYIEDEIEEADAFTSLPFTLFFCAAYATMVIIHGNTVQIRAVEESAEFDITENANFAFDSPAMGHKNLHDVHSIADFWSWAAKGLIPLIFIQAESFSEGMNESKPVFYARQGDNGEWFGKRNPDTNTTDWPLGRRGVYLNYNRIVGAMRWRQERAGPSRCAEPTRLGAFYNDSCVGYGYEIEPDAVEARNTQNAVNTTWFFVREELSFHEQHLLDLEANNYIDKKTNKVEIAIPIYTAEFGLHTMVTINFFFSRGGFIWKEIIPFSTFASFHTFWWYGIVDGIWVACILYIFKNECKEVRWVVKHKNWLALWTDYLGFWNGVDWISVFGGFCIIILYLLSRRGRQQCNAAATTLGGLDPEADWDTYKVETVIYVDALERVVKYVYVFKLVLAAYPLIIVLRLFKAFSAQPRLALVTKTLTVTGIDLLHFLIVFMSIFITLAVSGLVLFGRRLESFATLVRAINTVFRLMLGDFDWEDLRSVGQLEGAGWLVISLGCMNLLLLNMVLAIVMDGYSDVKRRSSNSDTLWKETIQIFKRWVGQRRRILVPLSAINSALLVMGKQNSGHKAPKAKNADSDEVLGPFIIGVDTRAEVGQRVKPKDEDIESFVGEGVIEVVGSGSTLCKVRHTNNALRTYKIGHDQIFELVLCDGERIIEIDEEEVHVHGMRGYSPEKLVKIMQAYLGGKFAMSRSQATNLLKEALTSYYKDNCEDVEFDNVRQLIRQVNFRMKKIKALMQAGAGGQTLSVRPVEDARKLREELCDYYTAVDQKRQRIREELRTKAAEIEKMWLKLSKSRMPVEEYHRIWDNLMKKHGTEAILHAGDEQLLNHVNLPTVQPPHHTEAGGSLWADDDEESPDSPLEDAAHLAHTKGLLEIEGPIRNEDEEGMDDIDERPDQVVPLKPKVSNALPKAKPSSQAPSTFSDREMSRSSWSPSELSEEERPLERLDDADLIQEVNDMLQEATESRRRIQPHKMIGDSEYLDEREEAPRRRQSREPMLFDGISDIASSYSTATNSRVQDSRGGLRARGAGAFSDSGWSNAGASAAGVSVAGSNVSSLQPRPRGGGSVIMSAISDYSDSDSAYTSMTSISSRRPRPPASSSHSELSFGRSRR